MRQGHPGEVARAGAKRPGGASAGAHARAPSASRTDTECPAVRPRREPSGFIGGRATGNVAHPDGETSGGALALDLFIKMQFLTLGHFQSR